jgi:hypothetical protein
LASAVRLAGVRRALPTAHLRLGRPVLGELSVARFLVSMAPQWSWLVAAWVALMRSALTLLMVHQASAPVALMTAQVALVMASLSSMAGPWARWVRSFPPRLTVPKQRFAAPR